MDIVKYFSGSRIIGTENWQSDLDTVVVYKHRFVDILRGIHIDDWDEYPKDLGDMYEIQKFTNELHQGNSFLYSVMVGNAKESTTPIWEKIEPMLMELGLMAIRGTPYNRQCWVTKNLQWFEDRMFGRAVNIPRSRMGLGTSYVYDSRYANIEACKRAVWVYYMTRQAIMFGTTNQFVINADVLLEDTTYGLGVLEAKRNMNEEHIKKLPWRAIYHEMKMLDAIAGDLEWSYEDMNSTANTLRCNILQEARLDQIQIESDDPDIMTPGPRTKWDEEAYQKRMEVFARERRENAVRNGYRLDDDLDSEEDGI